MFTFHRVRRGETEVFDIIVPEGGLPDAERRFGKALRYGMQDERHHSVGMLVFIHGEKKVEYLLTGKVGLTEDERTTLYRELEHLAGYDVHAFGADPNPAFKGTFEGGAKTGRGFMGRENP